MFELLIPPNTTPNGRSLLLAMKRSAPVPMKTISGGTPDPASVLMLYGMGAPDRFRTALDHVAAGGLLVAWDIGYWGRKGDLPERKLRVSINGLHPSAFVMRGAVPDARRWQSARTEVSPDAGDASGPVVLVGNGPKSNAAGAAGWAAAKSREIRDVMPNATVVYRPKPRRPFEQGVDCDHVDAISPIDAVLRRASLVVCRHSNVAVDACRLGVPVVCEDGAAAAIYPRRLEDRANQPTHETRVEFLRRLAWWQWSTNEAMRGEVWPWLLGVLDEIRQPVPA